MMVQPDPSLIAGVDLGDRTSHICLLDAVTGDVVEHSSIRTTVEAFGRYFGTNNRMRVALETGTHSPWVSRAIRDAGHEVITANSRQLQLVYSSRRKSDRVDAEKLARLARLDVKLLAPIVHRTEQVQQALAVLRSRAALVRSRTLLVNHVRGIIKSFGYRIPPGSTKAFPAVVREHVPEEISMGILPLVVTLESINEQILVLEKVVSSLAETDYPEVALLTQVPGVGLITALTFVLTLESPARFPNSRTVGAYLGLVPGRRQSGERDEKQRITKQGDVALRALLVQCAQYILRSSSPDSDLKRHGSRIAKSGTSGAKRAAVVAVARKLAVLLHALWITGEVYQPLRNHAGRPIGGQAMTA